ncbi:MAG TPA: restriction endonuclease subunit M [Desulfotomaculum sp.]|nr:restriction endonuclease subunit M [Desulfotomaculum sp.]
MKTLTAELRNKLERTIIRARDFAEAGAKSALESLAVHHYEPFSHMPPEDRRLRNHLRARARQLGARQDKYGSLEIYHLIQECAYEHWHRMLFARFLAENGLLIEPESGVAISLDECKELAEGEGLDLWTLASRFAQQMLPQIFRPDDPILLVAFAHEHQLRLENELSGLETDIFTASDALGWVYQFWQAKRKKEVNDSGIKIGADELPAVTQLFTEPYMVEFLIHNTLGAWHAGKMLSANPELAEKAQSEDELRKAVSLPGVSWDYLRFIHTDEGKGPWRPAAGVFEGWPQKASELKIIDPCCGSGHFLVAVLYHLVPIRMLEEGTSAHEACEKVLEENLFGLEIDERCTQIAAFALAFAAWTYPGADGYCKLPKLQIACSGIAPNTSKKDWINLAGDNERFRNGLEKLYDLFKDAPSLGSLIDPGHVVGGSLIEASFDELTPYLEKVMFMEKDNYELNELKVAACGITDAVQILNGRYHLIITNVPYLARGKQIKSFQDFCLEHYCEAKSDIATVFLDRLLLLNNQGGVTALVISQSWLSSTSYETFRIRLIKNKRWNFVAKLGPAAFETISGEVVNVALLAIANAKAEGFIAGLDASLATLCQEKASLLRSSEVMEVKQEEQLKNPDSRIVLGEIADKPLLGNFADTFQGIKTGDDLRYKRCFWEIEPSKYRWRFFQSGGTGEFPISGMEYCIDWIDQGHSMARLQGLQALNKIGIGKGTMSSLPTSIYFGDLFDSSISPIIPKQKEYFLPILTYCKSEQYLKEVRKIDPKVAVTNATFLKVPFDFEYWNEKAKKEYPLGDPKPLSENPTQWVFKGNIINSRNELHVAVSHLLRYCWPNQDVILDGKFDNDGIICLTPIVGKEPAAERLRALLIAAYGDYWTPTKEQELIASTWSTANDLDEWLRNDFFEQHCKIFHHRPFIWHIWDGRKRDGFHALVNYHKLAEGGGKGKKLLENLTYSYLGDWINRQKDGVRRNEDGAEDRLAAAVELQKRLIAILEGEPPFDIFVRWKPVEKQPVGWNPDINDGVRINIRPFMASDIPGGKNGAGVLRWKPNINWSKDRGKEPDRSKEQFPWFWKNGEFAGDRINDVHLANSEKLKARERAAGDPEVDINV